jgi:Rrf2 family protein
VVRLSKKVEYGLIAIKHIAKQSNGGVVTTKEIAELYRIPYQMLAKVLQKLTKAGLILSQHGMRGGYRLARDPAELKVSAIISAIEGTSPMITQCLADGPESCVVYPVCTIKSPLQKVQANIEQAFNRMTLLEIV